MSGLPFTAVLFLTEVRELDIHELRKKSMALPKTPGVYLMKNKAGRIIYVGKAKALKNRVSQYFGSQNNHPVKVRRMVENVFDFDYIMTDTEFEALVLECSLIKQYSPKYNILLKDDKGYSYIKITGGDWPQISAVKQKDDASATYIGPYISSFSVTGSVDEARKIFMLPDCGKKFPEEIGKSRPCLNYFIKQCSAPCAGKISREDYNESVASAIKFLKGDSADVIRELAGQMNEASEALEFEKAARLRDRINSIKKVNEKQKVVGSDVREQDVFAIAQAEDRMCLSVLRFSEGRLRDSEWFLFNELDSLPEMRRDLITRFYSMGRNIPARIAVDGEVEGLELLNEWLSHTAGHKVEVVIPQRGRQLETVNMCRSNASQKLALSLGRSGRTTAALDELARILDLEKPPVIIESYDISHTAGSDNVAGMVVFKNGLPYKKNYRRFSIKGFSGQDDYASMAEVISRRLNRYVEEKDSGEGFGVLPDLILLDGGVGQVNAVLPIVRAMGFDIPVYGMVKDNKHRTRAIASDGGEIAINSKRRAFTLVSTIQEEVHRFAISYHRSRHRASALSATLTKIEGIGEAHSKALLKHFKTVSAIKKANIDELCEVRGIGRDKAQKVYDYFRKNVDNT
ncbi:MAG: excinuclease ABC subunit UvrC [Clostridia bacterium]|nr:excinuclease ABC subunit UvrC [Clostridia bacterium]